LVILNITPVLFSCALSSCSTFLLFPFFSFTATPPTEIYTLSLHDALPIFASDLRRGQIRCRYRIRRRRCRGSLLCYWFRPVEYRDRKSTRLNSSHVSISYAVFCLKKKTKNNHKSTATTKTQCSSSMRLRSR